MLLACQQRAANLGDGRLPTCIIRLSQRCVMHSGITNRQAGVRHDRAVYYTLDKIDHVGLELQASNART